MHRFFLPPSAIQKNIVRFPAEQAHQVARVLRLRPGAEVVVLDDTGLAYEVTLTEVGRREAVGTVRATQPAPGEPTLRLTLCAALLKARKIEWVWQKATELGAVRLAPLVTERSVVDDPDDLNPNKLGRWETIIREAAEQSGRGRLPLLQPARPLAAALAEAQARGDRLIIPWEKARATPLRAALRAAPRPAALTLFIGPEGGFTAGEVAQAEAHGAIPVTLGPRILRAETAALAATAAAFYEVEGWDDEG